MATEKPTLQEKLAASKATNKVEAPEQEKKEVTLVGYKALRLRQFATAAGRMVKPNADGIFIPSTQEEYNMLEYYANQAIAYVERVFQE